MDDSEPVQLRHLRDILGAYAHQVLGWYSIADESPVPALTVERHQTTSTLIQGVEIEGEGVSKTVSTPLGLQSRWGDLFAVVSDSSTASPQHLR